MSDLISRQAAIDAILKQTVCATKRELVERCDANISDENGWLGGICIALDTIEDLPSAQPEIICCKDCKHYQLLSESCRSLRLKTGDEWYCADAERKVTE